MRAWRTHRYGRPTEVLQRDEVPIPEPGAGELRVRVQAIPFNLNDLERITGGNMMVRPELPYSPGMEVMGVVDACGAGAEGWQGKRVVAMPKGAHGGFAEYAICPAVSMFEMPEAIPLPDAAALYFPFHLAWLGRVFAPWLPERDPAEKRRRLAQLFTATEIYSWWVLRFRLGVDLETCRGAMHATVDALVASWSTKKKKKDVIEGGV